jgi:hypothetical protein
MVDVLWKVAEQSPLDGLQTPFRRVAFQFAGRACSNSFHQNEMTFLRAGDDRRRE